jgi:hypothetical protein
MFTILISLCALLTAGVAAFFSVKGIGLLFAGAMVETMVMASTLEVSKLMVVSFLYRFWHKTPKFLRTYLFIAVLALMSITSLGIYGFLSSAYQKSASQYGIYTQQVCLLEKQKEYVQKDLKNSDDRISTLNEARKLQEDSLNKESNANSKQAETNTSRLSQSRKIQENTMKLIENTTKELDKAQKRSDECLVKIKDFDMRIMELKETSKASKDIITFKFIADAIGWELDRVVKWFILIIIIVFDPLAVGMVLAYNIIVCGKMINNKDQPQNSTQPIDSKKVDTIQECKTDIKEQFSSGFNKTIVDNFIKSENVQPKNKIIEKIVSKVENIVKSEVPKIEPTTEVISDTKSFDDAMTELNNTIEQSNMSTETQKSSQEIYNEIQKRLEKQRQTGH